MKRRSILASAAALASPLSWAQTAVPRQANAKTREAASPPPSKLVFGIITPRNAEVTRKNWSPFLERMAVAAGVAIEARTYDKVDGLVKDFVDGKLDLAWLGNAPALEIVEAGKASLFAAMVVQGRTVYRSLLVTHRDSPLRTLEDVHRTAGQLVYGDGDLKSTSGHIVPKYFAFVKKGINEPNKIFKEVRHGSQEANLLAAAKRELDVATANSNELENFREARPDQIGFVRVIWESPDIPESPMIWRNDLPVALKGRIAAFTYGFGARDAEEKSILWNINKLTAWRKTTNRQLVTIADLEMFNARQVLMNDPKLSAQEKTTRVGDVIKRGSRLELMLKASS